MTFTGGAEQRLARQICSQSSYEFRVFWRNPLGAMFSFLMPVLILVFLVSAQTSPGTPKSLRQVLASYYVASLSSLGLISVFMGAGLTLMSRSGSGLLRRWRVLPLRMSAVFAALAVVLFLNSCGVVLLLVAVGRVAYHTASNITPGVLLLGLLLGAATFASLSLAMVGFLRNPYAAPTIINLLVFLIAITAGVFSVTTGGTLAAVGACLPGRPFVQLMAHGLGAIPLGSGKVLIDSATLAAWTLACSFIAKAAYRRDRRP